MPPKLEKKRSKAPNTKNGDCGHKLTGPQVVTFWIAALLVVLGVLASEGIISGLATYVFWLVVAGFVL